MFYGAILTPVKIINNKVTQLDLFATNVAEYVLLINEQMFPNLHTL